MASTNFKLFDENKTNMMSDTEYNINTQRLNGVQAGIASSQLQNKTLYQTSLMSYALAQIMNQNGIDSNDTAAVSAFINGLSDTLVQKVLDKATEQMAIAATDNSHYMTPALVKKSMERGNYGNFAAKGYTLASHEDRLNFDNVKQNEINSFVVFKNFDKFIYEQKPKTTDFIISIGKIKITVKNQSNTSNNKGFALHSVRSDNPLTDVWTYTTQLFEIPFDIPAGSSFEYNEIVAPMINFITGYEYNGGKVRRTRTFLTTSIFTNQIGKQVTWYDDYSQDLAFYQVAVQGTGIASVLFEDVSAWYR